MKKQINIIILLLFAANTFAKTSGRTERNLSRASLGNRTENSGISFTENKGQVYDQNYKSRADVLYGVMTGNMAVHIKKSGVSYQLYRLDRSKEGEDIKTKDVALSLSKGKRNEIEQQTIYRIDLNWLNYNPNFSQTQDETLPGYTNYYLESCPQGALKVRSYKGITLHNLYKGIDLHYYEKNGELKHDYLVAAHANYKQIQVKVEGAEIVANQDGSLLLTTPLGKIQEGAPVVFQNGKQLKARWRMENNVLSFEVEDYDPNLELTIDPVTRLWGTYYGGTGDDYGYSTATDASGNVYLGGYALTSTGTIIATVGSHQSVYSAGGNAFLAKFNTNGLRLWATYYGGSGGSTGLSCATDAANNVYLTGIAGTDPGTAIATVGCHQSSFGGGSLDAFLVKFDANGIRQWGTYYGGSGQDWARSCATDASGNVYISGKTSSSTGTTIATFGSHQPNYGTGTFDSYLVKFDANGNRQWGTYYGGLGEDEAYSCATDASGNVYVAGFTDSNTGTVIATIGSHQSVYGGGAIDSYLVKFDSNGGRQWATYYGGVGADRGYSCATDVFGNLYMVGGTDSNTGTAIATPGSHQPVFGGLAESYLVKFSSTGTRQWGTYYGGLGNEYTYTCVTDLNGNVYMAGQTSSGTNTSIATTGSFQSFNGGGTDAFLVKFNVNGVRQNGTYYGGIGNDYGYSCSVDASGNLFISGYTNTSSGSAIASSGSHQPSYGGGANEDAFLVKFAACNAPTQPSAITGSTILCSGAGASSYSIANVVGATSYTWSLPAGWSGSSNTNSILATPGSSGVFTVAAGNACGASPQQTLSVTVNSLPIVTASTSSTLLCEGESATLTASGAANYTFSPGGAATIIIVSPNITTTYTITGTDTNGCKNTASITQSVDACTSIKNEELKVKNLGLTIFPNPSKGIINVDLGFNTEIVIVNALGQVVYSSKFVSGTHQINLESLANGVYIVEIKNAKNLKTIKMIKE